MALYLAKKKSFEDVHLNDRVLALFDKGDFIRPGDHGRVVSKFRFTEMITLDFAGTRIEITVPDLKFFAFEGAE